MRTSAAIAMCLAVTGCLAGDAEEEAFEFGQSKPSSDGKSDEARACGAESCAPALCGYDCTEQGEQCERSCAASDGRASSFVAATVGSTSFDSRTNPYVPVFSLDNVLVYGCELWDYSSGAYDGLQIQYEELIHSSFTVNASDPTRTKHDFGLYVAPFTGPGSYRAQAQYRASHDSTQYAQKDACSLDVEADGMGGIKGRFDCTIGSQNAGSISVRGTFACAENAMSPIFSKWAAAPQ